MVKIALDPAMYHADLSVADEVRKAAELGYQYLEFSPRADFFFWHRYPKADAAELAEVKRACRETGVTIETLVPVFNWASPDEQERQAQVRNWRRLLEIAAELECPIVNSELSGNPNDPVRSEHAFYLSMQELAPVFERYGIGLNLEAHPYDFAERNDEAIGIIRGMNLPWVNYLFCAPHAFHLSDGAGDLRPDDGRGGRPDAASARRGLFQPQGERGQPVHRQSARGGRAGPSAQRDRQRRRRLG